MAQSSNLRNQLKAFGTLDHGSVMLHHMEIFLFIGEKGRATYADIEQEFHLSNAAASRCVNSMSSFARHRKTAAFDLMRIDRDPCEGRRYLVRLTAKGQQLYETITRIGL